ncbi:type-F conjugative transfer system mating-pair stabilization protein TraN [Candidatus Erwinia dacicola]|uniref:Type-F conjugative transfer system mating-pair stabilization protein TraN n=1 Tax=Candidatus Erwinia dacicola TaxID=252393 RepID=A0A328TZF8_9GAMM|nr:type-F conjugative transfer system mating-pair stabilization protein TraN [Candidatus Erwinia dacicola]
MLMSVLAFTTPMAGVNALADAGAQYKAGADFAKQVKGQGESSLKNFSPEASLPGYTATPEAQKYYGGVTSTGDGALKADGNSGWTHNEATKAVTDSFINNPKEAISPDAPFIKASQDVQSRADAIIGKTGQLQCDAQNITRSEFTNYSCERDLLVEQACIRSASVEVTGSVETVKTELVLDPAKSGPVYLSDWWVRYDFIVPEKGTIRNGTLDMRFPAKPNYNGGQFNYTVKISGASLNTKLNERHAFSAPVRQVAKGEKISLLMRYNTSGHYDSGRDAFVRNLKNGTYVLKVTFVMEAERYAPKPVVKWSESCPFSKSEGTLKKTECIEPGSTKTVVVEGKPYQVTQACWMYKDTYMTQAADNGTCKTYMNNPACTLASRTCAFTAEDGSCCLHEYATYSCETRTSGQVMICGGDTFCLDGDCERAQNGKNNDFAPVVSALAALAAAGKDVAAINSINVRAFTGSAKFCKKFAAGFSNCCKDGGWGQDVGLARCSSEEKALGKAKENKLTVSIGEFCSKKVLGVCLEKKRSYCQFDSKLAQIVQQQGRNGQLHIGFGKASSPDCRGITQTELQQINFEALDFSNFFDDLQKNKKIPDNDTLTKRVREEIAAQLKNK